MGVWDILTTYYPAFLSGLRVTLQLSVIICVCGQVLGSALGVAGWRCKLSIGIS